MVHQGKNSEKGGTNLNREFSKQGIHSQEALKKCLTLLVMK